MKNLKKKRKKSPSFHCWRKMIDLISSKKEKEKTQLPSTFQVTALGVNSPISSPYTLQRSVPSLQPNFLHLSLPFVPLLLAYFLLHSR